MIIEYNPKYVEDIKELLVELQSYIVDIDKEKYNIITDEYKEKYFNKMMDEVEKNDGKILLYVENNKVVGLIVGIINNEETLDYDFKAPKRGRITELIVSKNIRSKGVGSMLLEEMTKYLKEKNCKGVLIGVFGYNENAIKFYEKNGYHTRVIDLIKTDI